MRIKASVTIYTALMLLSVFVIVFALLEASRISVSRKKATVYTDLSCESLAGEYQDYAYDNWNIFMLDGGAQGKLDHGALNSRLSRYCKLCEDTEHSKALVQLRNESAEVEKFELVTDNNGDVMYELLRDGIKDSLTQDLLDELGKRYSGGEENRKLEDLKNRINLARDFLRRADEKEAEEARKQEEAKKKNGMADTKEQVKIASSGERQTIRKLLSVFSDSYLTLLVDDVGKLSNLSIDLNDRLINRQIQTGNYGENSKQKAYDKLILAYFCNQQFKSIINVNSEGIDNEEKKQLLYEMEYIVAGKSSDKANLENVLTYILLEREAVNYGYLMTDEAKVAQATSLAAAATGILGLPAAVEAVKQGILCAWAFCESVLEIRALMDGKRIYLVKTNENWNLSLSAVLERGANNFGIKEAENGFSYNDFICQRFVLGNRKSLIYRTMDVMEMNLQGHGYENARMDSMISRFSILEEWHFMPVFMDVSNANLGSGNIYRISERESFSFY